MNSGAMNLSETECPNCKKDEFSEKYSLKRHVNTSQFSRVPPRQSRWKYPLSDDPVPELPTALQCDPVPDLSPLSSKSSSQTMLTIWS